MATLPRGLQTGAVPTGPVSLDSPDAGLARIVQQVSSFSERIVLEQAQAEFTDAISAAEVATRDYLNNAQQVRSNGDGRPAFETAEQDFDEFYSRIENTALETLSTNQAKEAVQQRLKEMRADSQVKVRSIARNQRADDIRVRTQNAVERYVGMGEYDAARLALSNQKAYYSPQALDQVSDFIDSSESGAIHDQAVGTVMAGFAASLEGGKAAEYIRDFRDTSTFDQDETERLISRMHTQDRQYQAEQKALDAENRRAEAMAMQSRLFVLDARVDAGDAGAMEEIKTLLKSGDLTASQATSKRRRLEEKLEEQAKVVDAYSLLSAGVPLDPKNAQHKQMVEGEFQSIVKETGGLTVEARTAAARLVKQSNIIPGSLKQLANSARIAGSPTQVVEVADTVARIAEVAPLQYTQFSRDQRVFYDAVNSLVRANMDPELAVQAVREEQQKPALERKVFENQYKVATADEPNIEALTDWANDEFGGLPLIGDDPSVPDALIAAHETLTRTFFAKTRDIEQSRRLAQQELAGTWGATEVNGEKQMMPYALEKIHGDWAVEQLTDDMNAVGVSPGVWELVSDDITARTEGQSYAVMRRTPVGVEPILVPDADGLLQIARFVPDRDSSKQADRDKRRKRDFVNRAERRRQRDQHEVQRLIDERLAGGFE